VRPSSAIDLVVIEGHSTAILERIDHYQSVLCKSNDGVDADCNKTSCAINEAITMIGFALSSFVGIGWGNNMQ
jgi:hypothetical protein